MAHATASQSRDVPFVKQVVAMLMAFANALEAKYDAKLAEAVAGAKAALPDSYSRDVDAAHDLLDSSGQVNGFMVMIIGGAALIVGFFVVATINAALPSISNNELASDKNTTLDRIGQALVLGGVVLIVIGVTMVLRTLRSV